MTGGLLHGVLEPIPGVGQGREWKRAEGMAELQLGLNRLQGWADMAVLWEEAGHQLAALPLRRSQSLF